MKRWLFLYKLVLLYILCVLCHYHGYKKGWEGYKHSHNMQLSLDSAYNYGYKDCQQGF